MNQYTPWVEMELTEVEYWKQRYIESRAEHAREIRQYREQLHLSAKWLSQAKHDGRVSEELDSEILKWMDEQRAKG